MNEPSDESSLTVESARKWYERQMENLIEDVSLRKEEAGKGKKRASLKQDWKKSASNENRDYKTVETSFTGGYAIISLSEESLVKYEETKNPLYLMS
jgi:hypothetical protein